jgi:hypothetical protein
VDGDGGGVQEWTGIRLEECIELDGIYWHPPLAPRPLKFGMESQSPPLDYTNGFLTMVENEQRCKHPSMATNEPTTRCYDEVTNGEPVAGKCFA